MSHFSVLVVAENEGELDEKLAPFDEQVGKDSKYAVFKDITDECRQEYETEEIECVFIADEINIGPLYSQDYEAQKRARAGTDKLSTKTIPLKKAFPTFKKFMEYRDYSKVDGRYGYYYNPKAKWDWWQPGGRWPNVLHMYNGECTYVALAGDIDWIGMRDDHRAKQARVYDKWWAAYNEHSGVADEREVEDFEKWKKNYPPVAEAFPTIEEYVRVRHAFNYLGWIYWGLHDYRDYKQDKEQFLTPRALTYAFIDNNGNWNQRGEMGWWGMDDPSKGTENYDQKWWEFVLSLPPDATVWVIDCHI